LADKETNPYQQREPTNEDKVKKYFVHGLAFSLLMFVMALGWGFALFFLVMVGSIIGLIIGFVLLAYLTGWLNAFLLQSIWGINDGGDWKNLIANGFILLMLLLVVSVPQLVLTWLFPSVITSIVLFVPYCFVDGYVARKMVDSPF
jgi:hypothetical protein